jgi:cytidine deaminase
MDKEFKFTYKNLPLESLDGNDILLVEKALSGMDNAYAPYSNFKVGASVKLENGEIVVGNNQENIAYPSGLCAERVALFYVGANYPNETIETICIVAKGDLIPVDSVLAPCGSCRQVMIESEKRQSKPIRVILVNQNKTVVVIETVKHFLPFIFG